MRSIHKALVLFALALLWTAPVAADSASERGKKIFAKCKACHKVEAGKHKIGPSLAEVIGRTAGTAQGYKYSAAMQAYGASGVVWNDETLDTYLTNPRMCVKGTKMTFAGLKKQEQRADIIAYLKTLSGSLN